jgi:hypothetical protein
VKQNRIVSPKTRLDDFVPVYEFNEVHSIQIKASHTQAFEAIKAVTADEILFYRTLIWLRRFGGKYPVGMLNPAKGVPLLKVATSTSFLLLAEEPNSEIVIGSVIIAPPKFSIAALKAEDIRNLSTSGFAVAALNFLVEPVEPSTLRVVTETRVHATDKITRHKFARYWGVIYPGSALIRRMWLRAIKRRVKAASV